MVPTFELKGFIYDDPHCQIRCDIKDILRYYRHRNIKIVITVED